MKTIRIFFSLLLAGVTTMSMGFPAELTYTTNRLAEQPVKEANSENTKKAAALDVVEDEPVLETSVPTAERAITVKVFDVKGSLLMQKKVSMDEFLSKSVKVGLPSNTTFVMYHQNTAYYFMETGLAK